MAEQDPHFRRRDFLRAAAVAAPGIALASEGLLTPAWAQTQPAYQPTYFTAKEWSFLQAAVARLIPADETGPGALEAGVPEFLDRQMDTEYGHGGLWYLDGPFNPNAPPPRSATNMATTRATCTESASRMWRIIATKPITRILHP